MSAAAAAIPQFEIGDRLLEVIQAAVGETFRELFGTTVTLKSCVHAPTDQPPREISGLIGFVQNDLEGLLSIGFPRHTVFTALSPLYGITLNNIDDKVVDGVGEITNTIFGISKGAFAKDGFKFEMCLPMVMIGEGYFIYSYQPVNSVRLTFESPFGEFWVEIFKTKF